MPGRCDTPARSYFVYCEGKNGSRIFLFGTTKISPTLYLIYLKRIARISNSLHTPSKRSRTLHTLIAHRLMLKHIHSVNAERAHARHDVIPITAIRVVSGEVRILRCFQIGVV